MNRLFALLIASVISVSLVRAADADVEVYMTSTPAGEPETTFT